MNDMNEAMIQSMVNLIQFIYYQAPGYDCACNDGYRKVLDERDQSCVDIDECTEGNVSGFFKVT